MITKCCIGDIGKANKRAFTIVKEQIQSTLDSIKTDKSKQKVGIILDGKALIHALTDELRPGIAQVG